MGGVSVLRACRLALTAAAVVVTLLGHRSDNVLAQDAGDPEVIGWADEGDGNTVMCIEVFKLLLDHGGMAIQDGEIASGTLVANPKYADYANGMLKDALLMGQGVTTSVDPSTGRVTLRTDGGAAKSDNGELIDLNLMLKVSIDAMASELPPVCKDILIKRLVVSSGAGGGVGDPHLTTLDQVNYDFQEAGVFRLFESENLHVQVFQHKCTPTLHLGKRGPSCFQGVAVSFAGSVAKFFIMDNKIALGKGSSSLEWLSVHKIKGKSDGYRVFATVDEATYVDIMLTHWINNYPLFNVALRVSPYFKSANVQGLLGNWNGVKSDDIKNNAILARLHGFSLNDNLFTCTGDACSQFVSPPTMKDLNATTVPSEMKLLHQGFLPVSAADIPELSFTPVLVESTTTLRQRRTQTDTNDANDGDDAEYANYVERRARELCQQVFGQMAACQQYVTNTTNYIQAVCVGDAVLVGDLSIVDNTKVAYLRECRRELDARIEANTTSVDETAQLLTDRKSLSFGDLSTCPGGCSSRGSCLAAACKCDLGFTGLACDLVV